MFDRTAENSPDPNVSDNPARLTHSCHQVLSRRQMILLGRGLSAEVRRSEEDPRGDRWAEINPGRTGSRTARSETGTGQDPQDNQESEAPGETPRKIHTGNLGEDQAASNPSGTRGIWQNLGKNLRNSRHNSHRSVAILSTSVSRARADPSPDTDGDKEMQRALTGPSAHP